MVGNCGGDGLSDPLQNCIASSTPGEQVSGQIVHFSTSRMLDTPSRAVASMEIPVRGFMPDCVPRFATDADRRARLVDHGRGAGAASHVH